MYNTDTPIENAIFLKGDRTPQEYFTGTDWVNRLVPQDETRTYFIGNVVFEAGARPKRSDM